MTTRQRFTIGQGRARARTVKPAVSVGVGSAQTAAQARASLDTGALEAELRRARQRSYRNSQSTAFYKSWHWLGYCASAVQLLSGNCDIRAGESKLSGVKLSMKAK